MRAGRANVQEVARGIGLDNCIGGKFLHSGPGYGGSCFPEDAVALVETAQDTGTPVRIAEVVVAANDQRKRARARKVISACGGSVRDKTIAILGLTFKPHTDDMRDAPSLVFVAGLQDGGAKIRAYDPEGMEPAKGLMPDIHYAEDAYDCAAGADALVIVTEWNSFRTLDLGQLREIMSAPVLVDLRNVYRPEEVERLGFRYVSIGRR